MKVVIDGLEVNITAKDPTKRRTQKESAMWILNLIAIYAYEAGESYEKQGYTGITEQAYSIGKACHDANDKEGYYDDIR